MAPGALFREGIPCEGNINRIFGPRHLVGPLVYIHCYLRISAICCSRAFVILHSLLFKNVSDLLHIFQ